jgi:hypothetical protein
LVWIDARGSGYTKADLDRSRFDDRYGVAGHVRSLGYRVVTTGAGTISLFAARRMAFALTLRPLPDDIYRRPIGARRD